MSGMGVVRLGNPRREPSPVPLGWQLAQYGEVIDGEMVWSRLERSALFYCGPVEAKKALRARRKDYNVSLIDGGIEFDSYRCGCEPNSHLRGARTRITWESA